MPKITKAKLKQTENKIRKEFLTDIKKLSKKNTEKFLKLKQDSPTSLEYAVFKIIDDMTISLKGLKKNYSVEFKELYKKYRDL